MTPDKNHSVTLSVIPGEERISFHWFHGGEPVSREELESPTITVPEEGTSIIGGRNGFTGLIDEFGIFYRDEHERATIDPYVYRRSVKGVYGDGVIFADGFDGQYLFDDNLEITGEAFVAEGSFYLRPESSVVMPRFSVGQEKVFVEFDFTSAPLSDNQYIEIEFTDEHISDLLIDGAGSVKYDDGFVTEVSLQEPIYDVVFIHDQYGFSVLFNSIEIAKITEVDDFCDVSITIGNENSEDNLLLDRILVRSESLQVINSNAETVQNETETLTVEQKESAGSELADETAVESEEEDSETDDGVLIQ
jgi:hypothetical protein